MSRASKITGAVLGAVTLCGIGAGSALAATAPATPAPQAGGAAGVTGPHYPNARTGDYIFFNATPYELDLGTANDNADAGWQVQPGQSVLVPHDQMVHYGSYGSLIPTARLGYNPGGMQGADVENIQTTGYAPGVQTCSTDNGNDNGTIGCIVQSPNVPAGEAGPTQISIWNTDSRQSDPLTLDAKAEGADASAMGNFLSGIAQINSNWIGFQPDQANPISWGHGPQTLAGAPYWNCGSGEAQEQIGGQAQHSETTTVTGTISVQQGIKLFDTVNTSITASVSVGHAWTDSTTDTHTESKNVDPGYVAWINSMPATETVTGTVTMTGNAAQPIRFGNVSFSEPGRNASGNHALDYAYIAHSRPMTTDETNLYCGGPGPDGNHVSHVVIGGTVPDVTADATTSPNTAGGHRQNVATGQPAAEPTTEPTSRSTTQHASSTR